MYFEEIYKPKSKVELYITQSWCNYTKENQHHHKHRHPNSFIYGVYYIDLNEQKDTFFVLDTNSNPCEIKDPAEFLNKLIERNQETLNAYHQINEEFVKRR